MSEPYFTKAIETKAEIKQEVLTVDTKQINKKLSEDWDTILNVITKNSAKKKEILKDLLNITEDNRIELKTVSEDILKNVKIYGDKALESSDELQAYFNSDFIGKDSFIDIWLMKFPESDKKTEIESFLKSRNDAKGPKTQETFDTLFEDVFKKYEGTITALRTFYGYKDKLSWKPETIKNKFAINLEKHYLKSLNNDVITNIKKLFTLDISTSIKEMDNDKLTINALIDKIYKNIDDVIKIETEGTDEMKLFIGDVKDKALSNNYKILKTWINEILHNKKHLGLILFNGSIGIISAISGLLGIVSYTNGQKKIVDEKIKEIGNKKIEERFKQIKTKNDIEISGLKKKDKKDKR